MTRKEAAGPDDAFIRWSAAIKPWSPSGDGIDLLQVPHHGYELRRIYFCSVQALETLSVFTLAAKLG